MTFDNDSGPIYSILASKGDYCGFSPVTGPVNGDGFNYGCSNMPNRQETVQWMTRPGYEWMGPACWTITWISGCITSGVSPYGSDDLGNQHFGFDIYGFSMDPESEFAQNYPNGLYGTCGYRKFYDGMWTGSPCARPECSAQAGCE